MKSKVIIGAFTALLGFFAIDAPAQEVYFLGGARQNAQTGADTYMWQLEYLQPLGTHAAWSFSYLNEGHVPDHHRDGPALQLWARTDLLQQRLTLAAGVGAYRYFDTTGSGNASYEDDHGWGALTSLALTWHIHDPWLVQLRTNWIHAEHGVDNLSVLVGLGYRFDASSQAKGEYLPEKQTGNEITLLLGQATTNSFESDKSFSASVEYRRRLASFLEWTLSWIHEGNHGTENRSGMMTQLWAVRSLLDDRLTLGFGGGPYFIDTRHSGDDERVVGIFGITAGYRFLPQWMIRLSWNRVVTNSDSDSDIILVGLGYLF